MSYVITNIEYCLYAAMTIYYSRTWFPQIIDTCCRTGHSCVSGERDPILSEVQYCVKQNVFKYHPLFACIVVLYNLLKCMFFILQLGTGLYVG